MESLIKDIRYGLRSLWKRPTFAAIAVVTLALGIGANTAIFSAVNSVLLRPLSYPESDRLVLLRGTNLQKGITRSNMSIPDFADWQNQNQVFERMAGFVSGGVFLSTGDEIERVRSTGVSADFFAVMRIGALKGRVLSADDVNPGGDPVAVLGYGIWQQRFGGDQSIVGSQISLNGKSVTVVGVAPAGFDYPEQSEIWVPFSLNPAQERRDNRFLRAIARLKSGVPLDQAQAEFTTINQRLAQSYSETNVGWDVQLLTLQDSLVGPSRTPLLVLLVAVVFVLLIACGNIANLLLARATARQKEIAVRMALGASRSRLIRQLLTESLILACIGGAIGLLLSTWLTKLLIALNPPTPRFDEIRPDLRVLGFTIVLSLITGIIFGLAPALQGSRADLAFTLKESARGATGRHNRLRSLLMIAETALSFVLLVGAGLLIRSFVNLRHVEPGFNPNQLLVMRLTLPQGKYPAGQARSQVFDQALDQIRTLPGVESTGAVLTVPLGGDTLSVGRSLVREGRPLTPEESSNAAYLPITPDYFKTLQIPIIAGRGFTSTDRDEAPKVVIINQTLARQLWPGESPIGKRFMIWRDEKFEREVVGVVGDTRESLDAVADPQMYVPYAQDANWSSLSIVIRSQGDPAAIVTSVRNAIRSVDKQLPTYNIRTMSEVASASIGSRRASMLLLSAFASAALLLALMGIYGVTAFYVTQRTQEIGIRMALGAETQDVLKLFLKNGLVLATIGIAAGLLGTLALGRLIKGLLFGVSPTDETTLVIVALGLLVVSLTACYVPARRATRVDPLEALRYE